MLPAAPSSSSGVVTALCLISTSLACRALWRFLDKHCRRFLGMSLDIVLFEVFLKEILLHRPRNHTKLPPLIRRDASRSIDIKEMPKDKRSRANGVTLLGAIGDRLYSEQTMPSLRAGCPSFAGPDSDLSLDMSEVTVHDGIVPMMSCNFMHQFYRRIPVQTLEHATSDGADVMHVSAWPPFAPETEPGSAKENARFMVFILGGLTSDPSDLPGQSLLRRLANAGFRAIFVSRRGHLQPQRSSRLCWFGSDDDLESSILFLRQKFFSAADRTMPGMALLALSMGCVSAMTVAPKSMVLDKLVQGERPQGWHGTLDRFLSPDEATGGSPLPTEAASQLERLEKQAMDDYRTEATGQQRFKLEGSVLQCPGYDSKISFTCCQAPYTLPLLGRTQYFFVERNTDALFNGEEAAERGELHQSIMAARNYQDFHEACGHLSFTACELRAFLQWPPVDLASAETGLQYSKEEGRHGNGVFLLNRLVARRCALEWVLSLGGDGEDGKGHATAVKQQLQHAIGAGANFNAWDALELPQRWAVRKHVFQRVYETCQYAGTRDPVMPMLLINARNDPVTDVYLAGLRSGEETFKGMDASKPGHCALDGATKEWARTVHAVTDWGSHLPWLMNNDYKNGALLGRGERAWFAPGYSPEDAGYLRALEEGLVKKAESAGHEPSLLLRAARRVVLSLLRGLSRRCPSYFEELDGLPHLKSYSDRVSVEFLCSLRKEHSERTRGSCDGVPSVAIAA